MVKGPLGGAGQIDDLLYRGVLISLLIDCLLYTSYHIFRPFRRQGYAEEACRAVLNYAKEELACPVCAHVAKENTASIQMLEKLGVPYFIINPKRNV